MLTKLKLVALKLRSKKRSKVTKGKDPATTPRPFTSHGQTASSDMAWPPVNNRFRQLPVVTNPESSGKIRARLLMEVDYGSMGLE
jgi:hypothetical protein